MSKAADIVTGTLKADGTVVLDGKPPLAPGRVRLRIEAEAEPRAVEDTLSGPERARRFLEAVAEMRAAQRARGHQPRTAEEIDAEIRAFRDESEQELCELEDLQARLREGKSTGARVP